LAAPAWPVLIVLAGFGAAWLIWAEAASRPDTCSPRPAQPLARE